MSQYRIDFSAYESILARPSSDPTMKDVKILLTTDMRNLNNMWDLSGSYTNSFIKFLISGYIKNVYNQIPNEIQILIVAFCDTKNPYIQQHIGTIWIKSAATLKELRRQIYDEKFKDGNIKSHKYLLLSWLDDTYNIPLSFPVLYSGELWPQKLDWSLNHCVICVELLNEEIQSIPEGSRFLHIYFSKIVIANESEKDDHISITLKPVCWPPDHHIRIFYYNQNRETDGQHEIEYEHLSQFISNKYNISCQNLSIAMFNIGKRNWIILDDNTKQHFQKSQIFVFFDLSKCNIPDARNNNEKIRFIKQNVDKLGPPPLSRKKAQFYYLMNRYAESK
eukprot:552848_1